MKKFKKDSFPSFALSYCMAIIVGVWVGGWLFHLVPADGALDVWWKLPWVYTVIIIGVGTGGLSGYILNKLITKKE